MSEKHEGKKEPGKIADKEPKNQNVHQTVKDVDFLWQWFLDTEGIGGTLNGTDRRRLVGAGVRNNGFIDKAFDIARDNPSFMPPHFNVDAIVKSMFDLEDLRQLLFTLQQFAQAVSNALLVHSDSAYRDALRIYNTLQEQTRNKVDGAEPLFRALQTFFLRRRMPSGEEPTEMELDRDVNRLVHGKEDGEIIIKNERPHMTGGVHEIIDNVHKEKSAFKETVQGEIKE
jgi:hypothetical protein